ncbi:transcription/translation regulatory transformer protein RfaH [Pseudomonas sp. S1_E04]
MKVLAHHATAVRNIQSEAFCATAWYLVQCKANQDERAENNLVSQGYTCFRPKHRRERILKGQRKVVCESLFPSYLFIRVSSHDNWGPLRSTRGVLRVVGFGGQPLPVRDALIAQLYERDSGVTVETCLTRGEAVCIKEGPFAELKAIFMAMDGVERVLLLMNILQREQTISVPLSGVGKL